MECNVISWDIRHFVRLNQTHEIDLDPSYQRGSKVWNESKQQSLIASIINGYDIPKIYLRRLENGGYEIIDGKQRLTAIFRFLNDEFELATKGSNSFEFSAPSLRDDDAPDPKQGDSYKDLSLKWKNKIMGFSITVTIVGDADEVEVKGFFKLLNEGVTVNSPELRRSIGGTLMSSIKKLAKDDFFTEKAKLSNHRLLVEDFAARFALIEHTATQHGKPYQDLKRKFFDKLVRDYKRDEDDSSTKSDTLERIKKLEKAVTSNLRLMKGIFVNGSPLLEQSYIQLYYLFIRQIRLEYAHENLESLLKSFLEDFWVDFASLKQKILDEAEGNIQPSNLSEEELLKENKMRAFNSLQSKPNDKNSLEWRVNIMTGLFIEKYPDVVCKDPKRSFSNDERFIIFKLSGGKCANCGKIFKNFSDFEADHVISWKKGGPTTIANAQALCQTCNRSKGAR